jgi:hypothetical protein
MAYPSTEANNIRTEATELFRMMRVITSINDRYESLGGKEWFRTHFEDELGAPSQDITIDEFDAAMTTFGTMEAWLAQQAETMNKLLI